MTSRPSSLLPSHAPRSSLYPGGPTPFATSSSTANPTLQSTLAPTGAQARLAAKQAELEALKQLKEQSANMTKQMQRLADQVDQLVDGGDTVASVLSNWQGVFRAIQIAKASMNLSPPTNQHENEEDENQDLQELTKTPSTKPILLDTLVRLPVDLDSIVSLPQDGDETVVTEIIT